MFEVTTFGRISLRTASTGQTIDLLRHPKQLALLVYLAVEARSATRDELIGLFWPDATEHRARQSLTQAVSSLRGVLGSEAIITDGVARRVAPHIVRIDTADFDAAVEAERWSDAIARYHGEFLKGFLLPDASEFEDWTSRRRERYRRQVVRAAEARAKQLRRAGHILEATDVLRHASEVAPEREDLAGVIIEGYADAGQTVAAVDWFARYTRRFEEIFEASPKPALAARIEQLRAAARNALVPAPSQDLARKREDVEPGTAVGRSARGSPGIDSRLRFARRPLWSRAAVLGTMGVVSALGGAIWLGVGDTAEAEPGGRPTTLLISVANRTPDIGWRHLAQSLEETLAARLSNPPRLYVTIRPDLSSHTQMPPSHADAKPRVVRGDVDFVLAGSVHQTTERVRIDLRVSDGVSNRAIRALRVNRPRRDVFTLLDETAEELADTLRPLLGSAIGSRRARGRTTSTAAWSDLEHSKALLASAQAFAARGAAAQAAALIEIADSLARGATQADPHWLDGRIQLAQIERGRSLVQLARAPSNHAAASEYLADAAAIVSDAASRWPDEVEVHELAGTLSYERWVLAQPGDEAEHLLDEAARSLERAILVDPYAAHAWATLSNVHAGQGEYAASAVAAQRALERDAFGEQTDEMHHRLFHAYFELGRDEDAVRWCDAINRRRPGRALGAFCELNLQAWSSAREPDLATADSLIESLDADPPAFATTMKPRLRMLQAAVAARLGEVQTARRLLDDAVAAARSTGDTEAVSFHAAALVRLGELDAAREMLDEWIPSGSSRVPVERWFHELDGTDRLEL